MPADHCVLFKRVDRIRGTLGLGLGALILEALASRRAAYGWQCGSDDSAESAACRFLAAFSNCDDPESLCEGLTEGDCDDWLRSSLPQGRGNVYVWQACPALCSKCDDDYFSPTFLVPELGLPCDAGWQYIDGVCLRAFESTNAVGITWDDANSSCANEGASLANLSTPVRNSVAFHLAMNLPDRRYTQAWIGLRAASKETGWCWSAGSGGSCTAYSNFTDFGTSSGRDAGGDETEPVCAVLSSARLTHYWESLSCSSKDPQRYICSKGARYREISVGTCKDYGLTPITDAALCQTASVALGFGALPAVFVTDDDDDDDDDDKDDEDDNDDKDDKEDEDDDDDDDKEGESQRTGAQGCIFSSLSNLPLQVTSNFALRSSGDSLEEVYELCRPAQLYSSPEEEEEASDDFARQSRIVGLVAIVAVYGLLLTLACGQQKRLRSCCSSLCSAACELASSLLGRFRAGEMMPVPWGQELVVYRRSQSLALVFFFVLLTRLWRVTIEVRYPDRSCWNANTSIFRWSAHIGLSLLSILSAACFLATRRQVKAQAVLTSLVCFELTLRFCRAALEGEQALLKSSRAAEEMVFRTILSLALSPFKAFLVNFVYSIAFIWLYYMLFAEEAVVVVRDLITLTNNANTIPVCLSTFPLDSVESFFSFVLDPMLLQIASTSSATSASVEEMRTLWHALMRQSATVEGFSSIEGLIALWVTGCVMVFGSLSSTLAGTMAHQLGSQSVLKAVSGMLNNLCDCVVHLDHDLRITSPAPRLSSLLLFGRQDLQGTNFCDRLMPEDVARFEESLAKSNAGEADISAIGDAIPISLRDAMGIRVPCQVFHAKFVDSGGRPRILLGVNEVAERHRQATISHARIEGESISLPSDFLEAEDDDVAPLPTEALSARDSDSESGRSEGSQNSKPEESKKDPMQVDFYLHNLEVQASSYAFNHFVGIADTVGARLTDFFERPQDLLESLAGCCEAIAKGELQVPSVQKLGVMKAKGRKSLRKPWMQVEAMFPVLGSEDTARYVGSLRMTRIHPARSSQGSPQSAIERGFLGPLPQISLIRAGPISGGHVSL